MDCNLPGSSVHGIFQARVLEWGAIAFSAFIHYMLINIDLYVLCIHILNHIVKQKKSFKTRYSDIGFYINKCSLPLAMFFISSYGLKLLSSVFSV